MTRGVTSVAIAWLLSHAAITLHSQVREIPPDTQITIRRTGCFVQGSCPAYTLSINAAGAVTYNATSGARVTGSQTGQVDVAGVRRLLDMADRIGYFAFDNDYERFDVTDLPTTFVSVTSGGRTKSVRDYTGAPDTLKQFERTIDEVGRVYRWTSYDAPELRDALSTGVTFTTREFQGLLAQAGRRDDRSLMQTVLDVTTDRPTLLANVDWSSLRSGDAVQLLVSAGASVNALNPRGDPPLLQAVFAPAEVIKALLDVGARADVVSAAGKPPLWEAAALGNAGVVELLLDSGADPLAFFANRTVLDQVRDSARILRIMSRIDNGPFRPDPDRVIALLEAAITRRAAQAPPTASSVSPRRLVEPRYPKRVTVRGDVEVTVNVRPDGSVSSATIVRGPALLQAAALDAAMASTFDCRNCPRPMPYSMVVTFDPSRPARAAKCLWLWKCD